MSGTIDPRTLRRAAYRIAGEAVSLALLGVEFQYISVAPLARTGRTEGELIALGRGSWTPDEMSYVFGQWAANASGISDEFDLIKFPKPDLAEVSEELRNQILRLAAKAAAPICSLAEALLARETILAIECYQIIIARYRDRIA
ncbi:MAG TPA: hypothetical protein VKP61_17130 [Candidatus Acidoferrum sp.]|nr:hypothetical protein [Candidatus Acidoferrum sp.]